MRHQLALTILFLAIAVTISACETGHTHYSRPQPAQPAPKPEPVRPSTIRNPRCEDVEAFKVFQVTDDLALASVCEPSRFHSNDWICLGYVVAIPKQKGKIYYDDQIIAAPEGKCAAYVTTYGYETMQGRHKTVPVVAFVDARIPNPEK